MDARVQVVGTAYHVHAWLHPPPHTSRAARGRTRGATPEVTTAALLAPDAVGLAADDEYFEPRSKVGHSLLRIESNSMHPLCRYDDRTTSGAFSSSAWGRSAGWTARRPSSACSPGRSTQRATTGRRRGHCRTAVPSRHSARPCDWTDACGRGRAEKRDKWQWGVCVTPKKKTPCTLFYFTLFYFSS